LVAVPVDAAWSAFGAIVAISIGGGPLSSAGAAAASWAVARACGAASGSVAAVSASPWVGADVSALCAA
jgi:hypothetical protein